MLLRLRTRFKRWMGWVLFGLCAPLVAGGLCVDPGNIPETETCRDPGPIDIDALTILDEGGELPLVEGQQMPIVVGGQGVSMFPFRIRVSGEELPACMAQRSSLVSPVTGEEVSSYERGVVAEETGETAVRRTGVIWYGLGFGEYTESAVRLRVEVADMIEEVLVWLPGADQTPVVDSLVLDSETIREGDEFTVRIRFDRPSPPDGRMTLALVAEPEGSFTAPDPSLTPTSCDDCFVEVRVPPHLIEYEVTLRAEVASPSGATLRAYTNFQPLTERPSVSVPIQPSGP